MRVLVTGAAGFIGSNLVEELVRRGADVVAVDNFITGKPENIAPFLSAIRFIDGDLRDPAVCRQCCLGVDYVLHEAALGSVPRSVADPVTSNDHNVNGFLNILVAARDAGVKRFVYAASSSAYGDTTVLPKVETMPANPLSPYAVSKFVGELYASVFFRVYGLETIGLRYFNVFGPRQDPAGAYAAVIPRFISALMKGERPVIHGDGTQTRDFTYVSNVVDANLRALSASPEAAGNIFNIGAGGRITLNQLFFEISKVLGSSIQPIYTESRPGDVHDSQASIEKAHRFLGYTPTIDVHTGLELAVDWYREVIAPVRATTA